MNAGSTGTILIVSDDAVQSDSACAALRPRPLLVRSLDAADAGMAEAGSAPAVVLLIFRDLSTRGLAARVAALRQQWPGVPTLVLTEMKAENLLRLKDLLASEVADITSQWPHIVELISTLETSIALTGVAEVIRNATSIDPLVRRTLTDALALQPRAATVTGLARRVGVPVSTLSRRYAPVARASGVSLPTFLHAIQLADVAAARAVGTGLHAAYRAAGISRQTAAAAVARISDEKPADITSTAEKYRHWLLEQV